MSNLISVVQLVTWLQRRAFSRVPCILAGADIGVRGGILVLAWLALGSYLRGDPWWSDFNLAGAAVYGSQVFHMGLGWATLAGASLLLCVYAALGILFSLIIPSGAGLLRASTLGVAVAILWHYASESHVWSWISRDFFLYVNAWQLLVANVLFGLCLGWVPRRMSRLRFLFGEAAGTHPPPVPMPAMNSADPEDC